MKIGLCCFSFSEAAHQAGLRPDPFDPYDLIQLAVDNQLTGVEFPARRLPGTSEQELARCRARMEELGLDFTLAAGGVLTEDWNQQLEFAAALGAKSIRCTLSRILEGDRRKSPGPEWADYLQSLAETLNGTKHRAEDLGISLAIENHQDATSDDLVAICEKVDSPIVGINYDVGNALAVGEDPVEYARKCAPYLKHCHLKDYWVYLSTTGYRLVRCAFGHGAVPFREVFETLEAEGANPTFNIENGATKARHIQLLTDWFWDYYPEAPVQHILSALRIAHTWARPTDEDWQTPHEREESPEACAEYEMGQFELSVQNARAFMNMEN